MLPKSLNKKSENKNEARADDGSRRACVSVAKSCKAAGHRAACTEITGLHLVGIGLAALEQDVRLLFTNTHTSQQCFIL